MPVGVLDCPANLQHQPDTGGGREFVRIAITVQRHAVHVLHREPWQSFSRRPGIEEAGNVGVGKPGKNTALALEALEQLVRLQATVEQFDRCGLFHHAVAPLRLVDDPHAALAEQFERAPNAQPQRDRRTRQVARCSADGPFDHPVSQCVGG